MINLLIHKEIDGVMKYAISTCAVVGKNVESIKKLSEIVSELSFSDNPTSLQILGEVYGKPIAFNYFIGNMFYANNILMTHFFDKYRLRSSSGLASLTDQLIIRKYNESLSNDTSFCQLTSEMTDFTTFSESILPYIDFSSKGMTNWMPEHIISRVGIAYQDAKSNTDLLNLSMEIAKKRQAMNLSSNNR